MAVMAVMAVYARRRGSWDGQSVFWAVVAAVMMVVRCSLGCGPFVARYRDWQR